MQNFSKRAEIDGVWDIEGHVGFIEYHAGFLHNPSALAVGEFSKPKTKIALESELSDAILFSVCDPCRIQTCNPHIRSVVLYSVELMDRKEAVRTRLELATYGVTGRYSNQLNYRTR